MYFSKFKFLNADLFAYFFIWVYRGQAKNVIKHFASPEGDHLTLINVYRSCDEFLNKANTSISNEKSLKNMRKWCKDNFVNARSLRHACDVHRYFSGFNHKCCMIGF